MWLQKRPNHYTKMPYDVAVLMALHKYHPIKAWRLYLSLPLTQLAERSGLSEAELEAIESSNLHLKSDNLGRLAQALCLDTALIAVRYQHLQPTQTTWSYQHGC